MTVRTQVKISIEEENILDKAHDILYRLADILDEKGLENYDFSRDYFEELYNNIGFIIENFNGEGVIFNESED